MSTHKNAFLQNNKETPEKGISFCICFWDCALLRKTAIAKCNCRPFTLSDTQDFYQPVTVPVTVTTVTPLPAAVRAGTVIVTAPPVGSVRVLSAPTV